MYSPAAILSRYSRRAWHFILLGLELFGRSIIKLKDILSSAFSSAVDRAEFLSQAKRLVFESWQSVFAIMVALGTVIAVQLAPEFDKQGLGSQMGIVSGLAMTRELAPVIGCLMVATQYGSGIAAELANMKITEQVDALKVMKVSPIAYLVVPRFFAAMIFLPLEIWAAALIGLFSCYFVSNLVADISFSGFMSSIWSYMGVEDVYLCLFKASVFGCIIVLIASVLGLSAKGGATEVGRATTLTVILSFVTIVLVDLLVTSIYL